MLLKFRLLNQSDLKLQRTRRICKSRREKERMGLEDGWEH